MPFYPGAGAYREKDEGGASLMVDSVQGYIETGGRFHHAKGVIGRGGAKRFFVVTLKCLN